MCGHDIGTLHMPKLTNIAELIKTALISIWNAKGVH